MTEQTMDLSTQTNAAHEEDANVGWLELRPMIVDIVLIIGGYYVLARLYRNLTGLPEDSYLSPVIASKALTSPAIVVLLIVPSFLLFWRWRSLRWASIDQTKLLRIIILPAVVTVAWAYSTYDYNLYFDQAHYIDRILLLVLGGLVFLHPAFIPVFLVEAFILVYQFEHPLGSYSWTDKRIVLDVLILSSVWLYLAVIRRPRTGVFVFLAFTLLAAFYFPSGIRKIEIGWLPHNEMANLFIASHLNGWLVSLDTSTILYLADALDTFNLPILLGSTAVEVGSILLIVHRRAPFVLLPALFLLHMMIFLSAGILFWQWMVLDVALLFAAMRLSRKEGRRLFGLPLVALGLPLILLAPLRTYVLKSVPIDVFYPPRLAWFDTRLNTQYTLDAVGRSGSTYTVSGDFMAPYDEYFRQSRFSYLTEEPVLTERGTTDRQSIALVISEIDELAELTEAERRYGHVDFSSERAAKFDEFVRRYFKNLNKHSSKSFFLASIGPPPHFFSSSDAENLYDMQEPVVQIRVHQRKTLYDGETWRVLSDEVVRTIEISGT